MRQTLALLLLAATVGSTAAFAAPAPPIFSDAFVKASTMGDDPSVVRSRSVTVETSGLLPRDRGVPSKSALRLGLNLFADVEVTADLEAHTAPEQPYIAWRGQLEGVPGSVVTFVAARGQITGHVRTLDKLYRVRFLSPGKPDLYVIEELDTSRLPDEAPPIPVAAAQSREPEPQAKSFDDGKTVDVLVVYTPAARDEAGGKDAIENQISLAIDESNLILERSQVIPRVRLVHMAELPYQENFRNMDLDLFRLQGKGDGFLEPVHTLRNAYKADTVALIRDSGGGACGVGFLLGDGAPASRSFERYDFSVTALYCLSNSTLPHEMGHNWGCNHAREDPVGDGAFPYSYGFKVLNSTVAFRTIMAYACEGGCPRILNYSNPEVEESGQKTGDADNNNALSLNNVRSIITNFRLSNPSAAKTCKGKLGTFKACSGGGCSVCAQTLTSHPLYFFNHPLCNVNYACTGSRLAKCNANCPAPTSADSCNPAPNGWQGCGSSACGVCSSVEGEFPNYFRNHPACLRDVACGDSRSACNANCPAPGDADR